MYQGTLMLAKFFVLQIVSLLYQMTHHCHVLAHVCRLLFYVQLIVIFLKHYRCPKQPLQGCIMRFQYIASYCPKQPHHGATWDNHYISKKYPLPTRKKVVTYDLCIASRHINNITISVYLFIPVCQLCRENKLKSVPSSPG